MYVETSTRNPLQEGREAAKVVQVTSVVGEHTLVEASGQMLRGDVGVCEVLDLLRETVRQSGEEAHPHSHGEIPACYTEG